MRPIMTCTIFALAAAAVGGSALAASSDYYLKLGDVKGESASEGRLGQARSRSCPGRGVRP